MIKRLCMAIAQAFGLECHLSDDINELVAMFNQLLAGIESDKQLVVFLDAVDQLDEDDQAHDLHWLPVHLPQNVRVVMSCVKDPSRHGTSRLLAAIRLRDRKSLDLDEFELEEGDCRQIIQAVPTLAAKSLEENQIADLLRNPAIKNPLYLLVALEELRGFGSYELLNERIQFFVQAKNPCELFTQMIEWTSYDFDARIVKTILCGIAMSRFGLTETELQRLACLDVPSGDKQERVQRTREVSAFLRQIRAYLLYRGEFIDFYHRSLHDAVLTLFIDDATERATHGELADFFERRGKENRNRPWHDPQQRSLSELVYHRLKANDHDGVLAALLDEQFLEAKSRSGLWPLLSKELASAWTMLDDEDATRLFERIVKLASEDVLYNDVLHWLAYLDDGSEEFVGPNI